MVRLRPKTELLLYQMLWTAGRILQPTFRKLDEGFEAWAYRNGLLRQIQRLEAAGYIESRQMPFDNSRVHRLTEAGRVAALGGRDPEAAWSAPWDHKWRLFVFDIPESERFLRRRMTRSLSSMGCGCLQGSVWISAGLPPGIEEAFPEKGKDCSHLMILEAESRGSRVDRRMAEEAWDFEGINSLYRHHLEVMEGLPDNESRDSVGDLVAWAEKENAAWLAAVRADPLLPAPLLPKGYLGRRAWRRREAVLAKGQRLATSVLSAGNGLRGSS